MIVASLEIWQDGVDSPVHETEKEFTSVEEMRRWLLSQEGHPFMWIILKGYTETED